MLLAIDTATRYISLALHDSRTLHAEETWRTNNNHSTELAPALQNILARSETTIYDLTALAVSVGPGSYTGLRIGVALAKGLAFARGLPLVGVSTLDILAAGQPQFQGGLIVVVEAGRGRVVNATYQWRKGRWKARHEAQLMDWETLLATIDGPAMLTGEVNDEAQATIEAARANGVPVTLAAPVYRMRRAGFLAQEAHERMQEAGSSAKDTFQAAKLVPIYVKTKDTP